MRTKLIIEPHIHGAFGHDFNKCSADDVLHVARELLQRGVGGFFPTLVTDSIDNIKRQVEVIKEASEKTDYECAKILGVHLEGIFINPEKKGIHNEKQCKKLTVKNYQKIEDDFIKIVTLAPELDVDLIPYLKEKGVKVQAGHCVGSDLSHCNGVTHLFNAMKGIHHREPSTALSALINDDIYTEIIADGVHLSDDILKLIFKTKPADKIILISDALPITHSDLKETVFAGSKIYYDGVKATSKEGTIAGSTTLVPEIIKLLNKKGMFNPQFIENTYEYYDIGYLGEVDWDEDFNVVAITTEMRV